VQVWRVIGSHHGAGSDRARILGSARDRVKFGCMDGTNASAPRVDRWAVCLVAAATAATFLAVVTHPFVIWDDGDYLVRNPHFRGLGWANLRWMFTTAHLGHYVPVTWLTFGLDAWLWGVNP